MSTPKTVDNDIDQPNVTAINDWLVYRHKSSKHRAERIPMHFDVTRQSSGDCDSLERV